MDGLGEHQKHELGLLSFDNRIEPLLALTSTLSLFETVIDNIEKRGSTEIYEAIIGAATMLQAAGDADLSRPTGVVADAADATALSADPKEAGAAGGPGDASVPPMPPVASYARILVLTDGVSSNHGASAATALAAARSVGAVVDAIIVGSRPDEKLRKIVAATGCVPPRTIKYILTSVSRHNLPSLPTIYSPSPSPSLSLSLSLSQRQLLRHRQSR